MAAVAGHFVYLLRCRGNRIYTGYTTDVEARYAKHCAGKAAHFTTAFPPEKLLGSIQVADRSTGLRLEAAIKKRLTRQQKEQLVAELLACSPAPVAHVIEYRKAQKQDLQGILSLFAELNPRDVAIAEEPAKAIWKTLLTNPLVTFFVAESGARLVGTCHLVVVPNLTRGGKPYAVLENVVTLQSHRRHGIATQLLQRAIQCAREAGCYKVMLLSSAKRKEAHKLYAKLGFDGTTKKGFDLRFAD